LILVETAINYHLAYTNWFS